MASSSETPADSSEPDRRAYEQECLRETEEQLTRVASWDREPRKLQEVCLDGRYPDTRIVIRLWDQRYDREITRDYRIWQESAFVGYRGVREPPQVVGMLITTWSLEG
jgi:hypothetical protein